MAYQRKNRESKVSLTQEQIDQIESGKYRITEGVGAPEFEIHSKGNKQEKNHEHIPQNQNSSSGKKVI